MATSSFDNSSSNKSIYSLVKREVDEPSVNPTTPRLPVAAGVARGYNNMVSK